jgi:hypothetical protein
MKTRFPILLGVLGGMLVWVLLFPSFHFLEIWIFGESDPKSLAAMSGYYCIHRTILLFLCAIGGVFGIAYSQWRATMGVLFLICVLLVVAIFAAVFPR